VIEFDVESASVLEHAAAPTLSFDLALESPGDIRSVALNVEIRIAATRRAYAEAEQQRLVELFGRPEDWGRNLHAIHWTTLNVTVPAFSGRTVAELKVPCSYDVEVAGARYMNALEDGRVPLEFLFSGAVFHTDEGRLQVARIGWDKECDFRLPVSLWREAMDRHFPGAAWLRLDRDSYERLAAYKARHTHLTWERTIDALLAEAD
jgi:Family of unknown function (DUF6084)